MSTPLTTLRSHQGHFTEVICLDADAGSLADFAPQHVGPPTAETAGEFLIPAAGDEAPHPRLRMALWRRARQRWAAVAAAAWATARQAASPHLRPPTSASGVALLASVAALSALVAVPAFTSHGKPAAISIARGVTPLVMPLTAGGHQGAVHPGSRQRQVQVIAGSNASLLVEWADTPLVTDVEHPARSLQHLTETKLVPVADRTSDRVPRPVPGAVAHGTASAKPTVDTSASFRPAAVGWLTVTSAFPVRIMENGVDLGSGNAARWSLAEGPHRLTLVNDALEYREERDVTVTARRGVTLNVDTPHGTLHVNAQPWAEVFVDGWRAGETPLGNLSIPVGAHELVLRHPGAGEQRRMVTIGARTPIRLAVEFKP